jgi:hypothetical protein
MKKGEECGDKKLRDDKLWATVITSVAMKNPFGHTITGNIFP